MTAQLPSTEYTLEYLREIAYRGSYDDMQRNLARALLAAHEQEPVAYSLIFRNMDGVLNSDINTNTTFATREKAEAYGRGGRYETQPDGSLKWVADENLDPVVVPLYAHPAPVSAGQDNWKGQLTGTQCTPESVSKLSTGTSVGVAIVPAVPENPPFAVMQRALDAFYAEDDEVPENQMLAAYRVFRAAMLNGGKS
ncbi:hypothetical protein [Phytobacter sp. MRY16-398]|uniref:hypothetical protein n=1 Tax=Phytobacter sp. MRY16-398 TaxID=2487150 RepID=UPI000DF63E88|nr:hypothetical protein [Phytobacter sp. MRY16-398]BBE76232.1 hypothetical protein MRY16398_12880 [Phytobacter sp. MRY16-398]